MKRIWLSLTAAALLALTGCGAKDEKPAVVTGTSAPPGPSSSTLSSSSKSVAQSKPTATQQASIDDGSEAEIVPLLSSDPVSAQNNFFGAISYSPNTGAYGYSYDYSNQQTAIDAAQNECNQESGRIGDCENLVWFQNACASLAVASNGSYGSGWGEDPDLAEYYALDTCYDYDGSDCYILETVCTTGANF